jgi:hypothetical protein
MEERDPVPNGQANAKECPLPLKVAPVSNQSLFSVPGLDHLRFRSEKTFHALRLMVLWAKQREWCVV